MKKIKRYRSKLTAFLALVFLCSFFGVGSLTASAASTVLYQADTFYTDFETPESAGVTGGYLGNTQNSNSANNNLYMSFESNYSDSLIVPYVYASPTSGTVSGTYMSLKLYTKHGNIGNYGDGIAYTVSLPVHFLVIGDSYYPSTYLKIKLQYKDVGSDEWQYMTFDASDYNFVEANRSHFDVKFNFEVNGSVLNTLNSIEFLGYRSVAKPSPIRMSIGDGGFTISTFNELGKVEDALTGSYYQAPDDSDLSGSLSQEEFLTKYYLGEGSNKYLAFLKENMSLVTENYTFLNSLTAVNNVLRYIWSNAYIGRLVIFSLLIGSFAFIVGLASSFSSLRKGGKND